MSKTVYTNGFFLLFVRKLSNGTGMQNALLCTWSCKVKSQLQDVLGRGGTEWCIKSQEACVTSKHVKA
eukprot:848598-Amphidinium_carterae.1